jgi:hypothetical protein
LAEANRLYNEAINLLALIDGFDPYFMANIWAQKGATENLLGLGDGAVQTFTGALLLIQDYPEGAMHAHIFGDLGYAHRLASQRTDKGDDVRIAHIKEARQCWQHCLRILTDQGDSLKQLPNYPYEGLMIYCNQSLLETTEES